MSLETTLKKIPLFALLDDAQRQSAITAGEERSIAAGQTIFREGDDAVHLYVLLTGEVNIYLRDDNGNELSLIKLQDGDCFGEMALLDGSVRSASASTLTPCTFFVLGKTPFFELLRASPALLSYMFTELTTKTRETSQKFFQEELAKQSIQAEMELERHRALSLMVAAVAHEINTPIGTANTALSIIKGELTAPPWTTFEDDPALQESLGTIFEAVDLMERNLLRAHKLVQNFKKVSVNELNDTLTSMNLTEAVKEIVDLFKLTARKAKLAIEIQDQLSEGTRAWVGYQGYLTQILLNFLSNIERYAYPKGEGGRVVVSLATDTQRREPSFVLKVQDFGKGIPATHLSKIFDPFFTTGRPIGGTGLGMAIVKNIVTGPLKGDVSIEAQEGKGTTIFVTFPQRLSEA